MFLADLHIKLLHRALVLFKNKIFPPHPLFQNKQPPSPKKTPKQPERQLYEVPYDLTSLLLILKLVVSSESEWWSYCTHSLACERQDFQHVPISSCTVTQQTLLLEMQHCSWGSVNTNLVDEHLCSGKPHVLVRSREPEIFSEDLVLKSSTYFTCTPSRTS